jgi:glycosyltransferase involved in cell wall biosynthesis
VRLLSITAGAGQMYCGSCLRDNALAAELTRRGHDVLLVPVYTPTLTDEPNVSRNEVLLGGVSVYLEQRLPLFRWTPKWLDRIWDSPAVIRAATKRSISTDPAMLGEMTVSMLRGENGPFRKEIDKILDWLRDEPAPDLTILPNTLLISLAAPIARATRRPVGVTLQGEDLFLENLEKHYRDEAIRLIGEQAKSVDAFFPVSEFYAPAMTKMLGLPADRVHVVALGVTADDFTPRVRPASAPVPMLPRLGFFARVAPEKGLHVLADAYIRLRCSGRLMSGSLEAAGYLAPEHRDYLRKIERTVADAGLAGEFHYRGVLERDAKVAFFQSLDVFSMPVTYDEPKALSVMEAMAAGVPVVQPSRGACVEIVNRTGGGLLVPPGDVDALAEGLATVLEHPRLAARLAEAGALGVRSHYTVRRMADRAIEVYSNVANHR